MPPDELDAAGAWMLQAEIARTALSACRAALEPLLAGGGASGGDGRRAVRPSRGAAAPRLSAGAEEAGEEGNAGALRALWVLQTSVGVFDAATDPAIWQQVIGFLSETCTLEKLPTLVQGGLCCPLLEVLLPVVPTHEQALHAALRSFLGIVVLEETGHKLRDAWGTGAEGTIDGRGLAVALRAAADFLLQQQGPSDGALQPDNVVCAFIRAATAVPGHAMPPLLYEILQTSLQPTAAPQVKAYAVRALPFLVLHGLQAPLEAAEWINLIHRLEGADDDDAEVSLLIPPTLADFLCATCSRNPVAAKSSGDSQGALDNSCGGSRETSRGGRFLAHHRVRCRGGLDLENVLNRADTEAPDLAKPSSSCVCSVLPVDQSKQIFAILRRLIDRNSRCKGPMQVSIVQAIPVILLHVNRDAVRRERLLLKSFLDLVTADDAMPSARVAAAKVIGALSRDDGWGLMAMENVSSLEAAVAAVRDKLEDAWAHGEPSDELVAAKMEGAFLALGYMASTLAADSEPAKGGLRVTQDKCDEVVLSQAVGDRLSLITPLVLDLVINCASCYEKEQHRLVDIAYQAVDRIGRAVGGSVLSVVGDHVIKKHIYMKIVSILRDNDLLFGAFCAVFYSVVNTNDFRNKMLMEIAPNVVPDLIVRREEELICLVASVAGQPTEELVFGVFASIMTHLFLLRDDRKSPNLFQETVELSFRLALLDSPEERSTIISISACETIDMVVWEICLYEEPDDVRHGRLVFDKICRFYCDPNIDVRMRDNDPEPPLAVLIRHRTFQHYYSRLMHNYYTNFFKSKDSRLSDQYRALKVVNYTIPLLGTFLDEHYTYLESILKSAQSIPGLREFVCQVWSTLIQSLGPTSLQIKSNLTQIVVNLFGIGEWFPNLVAPSIKFLLNNPALIDLIKLIPCVQTEQPLLQPAVKLLSAQMKGLPLVELLERHLHGIECGDEVVQLYALIELQHTLRTHRKDIASVFMGDLGSGLPALAVEVKKVITELLRLSNLGRMDFRVMSSECLGEIGAIDPARIGLLRMEQEAFGSKSDDDLAIEIICSHLVRILKRGPSRTLGSATVKSNQARVILFERVHYAIQELLKFLKCDVAEVCEVLSKPSRSGGFSQHPKGVPESRAHDGRASPEDIARGRQNWSKLAPEVQQIVKPFLAGRLIFKDKSACEPPKSKPTYMRGIRLHMWAAAFQRELIARMEGTRADIFRVVKPLLKYDSIITIFLLPHTIFDTVCLGDDVLRNLVRDEMLQVLRETSGQEDEVDNGTILSVKDRRQFRIATAQPSALSPQDYIGKMLKIGSESRRITNADAAGHLTVDYPFSTRGPLADSNQSYTVHPTSKWSTGASVAGAEDTQDACGGTTITQQVFGLIESLARWYEQASMNLKKSQTSTNNAAAAATALSTLNASKVANISSFLSSIPKRILAETSFRCGAYDRALQYLETSVRETWKAQRVRGQRFPPPLEQRCDQETVKLLQRIYAGLDDVDGLMGVAKLRGESTLEEQVLDSEIAGDWTAALACYEQASQEEPATMKNHQGLLRCLRNLGHLQTMLTHAEGCMNRYPHESALFRNSAVQAAWRLGRWDLVEELTVRTYAEEGKNTFDFNLCHALLTMKAKDQNGFYKHIRRARIAVLEPLAAASMESYNRTYPLLVRLQMVSELQQLGEILIQAEEITDSTRVRAKDAMKDWDLRLQMTQASLLGREPLLALRRVLFQLLGMKGEVADGWVQFARAARCAGHDRTAQSAIMQADRYGASRAHLERAKLKWNSPAERHESVRVLRDYLDRTRNLKVGRDEQIYTKTLVLYWRWVQEMGLHQTSDVADKFQEEMSDADGNAICRGTEKTHFLLGHFYDTQVFPDRHTGSRYSAAAGTLQPGSQAARNFPWVLHHYAQSLLHGYKHIFQSLPRLLTLWFENYEPLKQDERHRANTTLRMLKERLPPYIWLTVFSQLISRICHPDADILQCLKDIIARVLHKHPKQALWSLVAVLKSSQTERFANARDIRDRAALLADRSRDAAAKRSMEDFLGRLVEELIRVCNLAAATAGTSGSAKMPKTLSLGKHCKSLAALGPLESVIVPLQSLLTPTLPPGGSFEPGHNPFPARLVTLQGFGDRVDVMSSLMCPVVVRFIGSDGREYKFLCKPKDDLRKDSRMMDFNTMINRLLAKDADARRRSLYVRTFSVIPLNENNGLIQWVNDTTVLREILNDLYTHELGPNSFRTARLQELYNRELKPRGSHGPVEFYEKVLLPQFPPVLHKWLLDKFPAPARWVAARNAYTRTLAVWSMVGYVVGLGDRHAENIMFDATTGDCVHVDFSCLFGKGETLTVPERVPFRLTPNLVDPLGVCGHEGGFTRVCGVGMAVLRGNKDALMNVLETFLHDPLVEWSRRPDEAPRILSKCERRLRGEVTRFPADRDIRQVLSVDGQVRAVIAEATSSDNLAHMYRWWMPWY